MIQIYKPDNTNFNMNGDAVLHPLSCYVDLNLNGSWTLEIKNIVDENIELFVKEAVIAAPTPYGEKQFFRVYDVEKGNEQVKCLARPIFLDARYDCFIVDVRPTNKTGQDALNDILSPNSKYSAESNITKVSTAYYQMKNAIRAINGDDENSFISRWGGEIVYDNFKIIVNERIGSSDKNIRCKRGLNQLGIKERIQSNNVITRIIPKGYNGRILPNNETIDSERINAYPYAKVDVFEYDDIKLNTDENIMDGDEVYANIDELYQALRNRAKKEYDVNQVDIPEISYDVEMIDQYNLDEYKVFKQVMACQLGDDLIIDDEKLKINNIKARIIGLKYNCITRNNESLTIGKYTKSFFDETSRFNHAVKEVVNTKNKTVFGEKIRGIIDLMTTSLKVQKNIAQTQDVRAILFEDLDEKSETFGALCIGTQGIQIAKKRNETNTDWEWGTAISFKAIIADFIITGVLTDKKGNNSWNLDTGYLVTRYLKATDAEIIGKVIAKSGEIGGFELDEYKMTATTTKVYDFTWDDWDAIGAFIYDGVMPTQEQIERYDLDGDGVVTDRDRTAILEIIDAGNTLTTEFTLYPKFTTGANATPVFELTVKGKSRVWIDKLGQLNADRGFFDRLFINGTVLENMFSPIGSNEENGSCVEVWRGSDKSPFFYVGAIEQFKYFLVQCGDANNSFATWIFVPYSQTYLDEDFRGIGGYETESSVNGGEIQFIRGTVSAGTIFIESAWMRKTASMTDQSKTTQLYVKRVVGVK